MPRVYPEGNLVRDTAGNKLGMPSQMSSERSKKMIEFKELAAVVMTDIREDGLPRSLFVLIERDGSMQVKFPSGRSMHVFPPKQAAAGDVVQSAVKIAEAAAVDYCGAEGLRAPNCTTHLKPEGLDEERTLAWMRDTVGLEVTFLAVHEA